VKAKVFDGVLTNQGLFPGNFVFYLPQKREKEASPFHTVLQGWSSQWRSSTYWRDVQLCWLADKSLRSDTKAVLKIVGEFLKPVATASRLSELFSHYWDFPIGRQK
jgi:hypothetical protein